ncbi:putative peptidoglycan-binding domain-containing protein [Sphingomonas naphthae]|uniref:Peptidoglycan-binding domain-containing protein n=1 Tax=Sphingomonas naphthae TaxID=1813468 RepID=A0ABY7TIB6_9SPHN|nr:putative peptidoglycan-binding domain-containing protein [Sphingomonas naphthae]WCT72074.1 putative peptidoglycan-binding domain-containing protein [Sphingomonas naphthae]
MISPDGFFAAYIRRWEGSERRGYLSLDPNDNGNWYLPGAKAQKKGQGALVGSNFGVTAATLATYLGRTNISAADIKAIDLAKAVAIARKLFYVGPGLDRLVWNRATASIVDFGWGAGPVASIKLLQDLLDVGQDGVIGVNGATARAFAARAARSEEAMAGAWWAMREEYYENLVARRPSDGIYLAGWDNRSDWFMPGHPENWWGKSA